MSTLTEPQAKKLKRIPARCRGTYRRACSGRSLRAAIDSFCWECFCWQRSMVADCTALGCPLFPYRPGRRRKRSAGARGAVTGALETTIGAGSVSRAGQAGDRKKSGLKNVPGEVV